jgi:hypothetical protein
LLTPESLLDLAISKGKTLNDSRWAPRNFDKRWDHPKPLPPKKYHPKLEPITPPSSSRKQFNLSPTAEKFTPNSTPPKQHELSPKVEPFRPMTTSTPPNQLKLSPMVPFSIPSSYKMCGLDGSRYADKRQNTGKFTRFEINLGISLTIIKLIRSQQEWIRRVQSTNSTKLNLELSF